MKDRSDDQLHHEWMLLPQIAPKECKYWSSWGAGCHSVSTCCLPVWCLICLPVKLHHIGYTNMGTTESSCGKGVYNIYGSFALFRCQSWHSCGDILALWMFDIPVLYPSCTCICGSWFTCFSLFTNCPQNLPMVAIIFCCFILAMCFPLIKFHHVFQFFRNFNFTLVKFLLAFSIYVLYMYVLEITKPHGPF